MSSCLNVCCQAEVEMIPVNEQASEETIDGNPEPRAEAEGEPQTQDSTPEALQTPTEQPPESVEAPDVGNPQPQQSGSPSGDGGNPNSFDIVNRPQPGSWLTAGDDGRMVHDLVTCIQSIVGESSEGRGELVHACFRAYLAAEWAQRKGHFKELTVDQTASLAIYTYQFMGESVYRRMNDLIQNICEGNQGAIPEELERLRNAWKPFIRLFTSAVVTGAEQLQHVRLFRGQPLGCVDTTKEGPYSPHRFFSTSTNRDAARRFPQENNSGGKELLNIAVEGDAAVYGIKLSPVSIFSEDEVLLLPNQQFGVQKEEAQNQVAPMLQNPVPAARPAGQPARGGAGGAGAGSPPAAAAAPPVQIGKALDEGDRREVHMRPLRSAEETLRELWPEPGCETQSPGISVVVTPRPQRTTDGSTLTFKMPSGLCDGGMLTYKGQDAGGLVNERTYQLRIQVRDYGRQMETIELLDPGNGGSAVPLPRELPPGAKFGHVAMFVVSSDEHRRLFKQAGKAWVAFKFGGNDEICGLKLPFGMQRGGVRIVETMRSATFCLWYAQADMLSAVLITVLLALEGHSGVTYLFPFVDILVQIIFSLRLFWLNGRTDIKHPNQLLAVRFPFYLIRLACGIGALYLYITFDKNEEDHLPLLLIVAFKVFTPLSMFFTALFSLGYTDGVGERVSRSADLDHFINEKREAMSKYRYGASIFVFYDACLHGYMANLGHVVGAFLVFAAFCVGAFIDYIRVLIMLCLCFCGDKNDGAAAIIFCPCPPLCIAYPCFVMGGIACVAAEVAYKATEARMDAWEEAGGETVCLVALGAWQHRRFEGLASAAYLRAKRAEHRRLLQEHRANLANEHRANQQQEQQPPAGSAGEPVLSV